MWKYSSNIVVGIASDGKYIRKRVCSNSKAEFERKKFDMKKEFEGLDHPSDITFKKYAEKWLETYKSSREAATIAMYRNCLKHTGSIDYIPLKDIRPSDLQRVITHKADSPSVCQQIALLFRQIWGCAVQDGILSKDITKRLNLPIVVRQERRALKKSEIEAVRSANLDPMDRMFVNLLYYFGLRPQEALAVMPKDFDFSDMTLTISRAVGYEGNDYYIKSSKNRKVRRIPIPTQLVGDLKAYLKNNKGLYLIHRDGHPLTKSSQVKMWQRIKKEINRQLGGTDTLDLTDGLVPYVFRHNFCTECYTRKVSIIKCAELLGNSPQMVMNVYTHLDNSREPLDSLKQLSM